MANTKRDYYRVLGVSRDTGIDEIKKKYRQISLKYHPDRNKADKAAEQRFKFRFNDRIVKGYIDRIERQPDGGLVVIDFKTGAKPSEITKSGVREDVQMNIYCIAVQEMYGKLPVRASFYYLKEDKMVDYVPDEESIAAFEERMEVMIAAVCAEEFPAKPSYMGCQRCDYVDLCEVGERL
jgi:DNA helicase-2/ATP-dependent DNA helicase PcrA